MDCAAGDSNIGLDLRGVPREIRVAKKVPTYAPLYLVGGAITILKNDGVRQWGWDDIPYMKWKIKFMFETTLNQVPGMFTYVKHMLFILGLDLTSKVYLALW
jgi:hypothetical protein